MTRSTRAGLFFTCAALAIGAAAVGPPARQAGSGAPVRQLAYLKASNSEGSDHFGCGGSLPGHIGNAIAVSGDGSTVAVGAPHESSAARGINGNQEDNSLYQSGAVYVYVRRGDAWTQQAYVKASNAGGSDMFGLSLAVSRDGNTLAVAAPWEASAATGVDGNQDDNSIPQAGAVYIFTRAGNTWSQHSYIKASNTGRKGVGDDIEGDQFGFSIALSGDGSTLAVGAVSEDSNATGINGLQTDDSAASSGAVYLFRKTGNTWAQEAYLKSSNSEAGDLFGYGVGLSADGNALAVAAYDEDGSGKRVNRRAATSIRFPPISRPVHRARHTSGRAVETHGPSRRSSRRRTRISRTGSRCASPSAATGPGCWWAPRWKTAARRASTDHRMTTPRWTLARRICSRATGRRGARRRTSRRRMPTRTTSSGALWRSATTDEPSPPGRGWRAALREPSMGIRTTTKPVKPAPRTYLRFAISKKTTTSRRTRPFS
jgi:hypothetical protein